MLIENERYCRNKKTGNIIKKQEVELKCDDCGIIWKTLYRGEKRKVKGPNSPDYCRKCRMLHRRKPISYIKKGKMKVKCLGCKEKFLRIPSRVVKNNFCSLKCRDEYNIINRYGHLYKTFNKNINEVSYLFGLILGDGHLKKLDQKNTTRVSIAFNVKYDKLLNIFKKVAKKLKINYFIEPKCHHNCQVLGFMLTDKLLNKYGMLYNGAKYDSQPKPIKGIVNNINFVVGLINSDGWCGYMSKRYRIISFVNTTFSIIKCFKQNLENNKIDYKCYHVNGRIDKRTNNMSKEQWLITIRKKDSIKKLIDKSYFNLKEFK